MRRCYYLALSLRHPVAPFRQGNHHHHHAPPSIVLEAVSCHASVAVHRDYSIQAFSLSRTLLQGVVPPTPQCLRTRVELDGLFKESEYGQKHQAFLPFFVAGTERKPQCNVCGLHIGQHPQTSVPEKQAPFFIDGGAWPTPLDPAPSKTELEVSFVKTTPGKWCFDPSVCERMIRNREYPYD